MKTHRSVFIAAAISLVLGSTFVFSDSGSSFLTAVGLNNAVAPTRSNQIGIQDLGGNLQAASPSNPVPADIKKIGGTIFSLGQGVMSQSLPVTIASDQSALLVSNGGTFATQSTLAAGSAIVGKFGIDQTTPGTTDGVTAVGNVASLAADSGKPIKTGAVYNTTNVGPTNGQRVDNQANNIGSVSISTNASVPASADAVSNTIAKLACTNAAASLVAQCVQNVDAYLFNGTTWDRPRSIQGDNGTGIGVAAVAIAPVTIAGLSTFNNIVTNTALQIKATVGQIYAWHLFSTSTAVCYLQVFYKPVASVTLGTTVADFVIGLEIGGHTDYSEAIGIGVGGTGLTIAATSTRGGSTACTTGGIESSMFYK